MERKSFLRITAIVALILICLYSGAIFVFATPPSSPYTSGATLDPSCAPGDTNCTVETQFTGTAGSVLFLGSDGTAAQDNSNLFWDDTNNRLGIGISTPLQALHIVGNFQLVGAFMPGGNAGTAASAGSYDLLTSNGSGSSPVWSSFNFNDIADSRIDLQKGAASGLAPLDSSSKVPLANLPATVFSNTFVKTDLDTTVGDKCTDLSSSVVGDVCIATSDAKSYILQNTPGSAMTNWIEIITPGAPVTSVNGAIGGVSLTGTNGLTVSGTAFSLGGTLTAATTIAMAGNDLKLTGTGNVGIGTASPAARLDVAGSIRFTGALMPGGISGDAPTGSEYSVLVSQGTGAVPTWEPFDFNSISDARIALISGAVGGFAPLDSSLRIPLSYLPATVFSNTYVRTNFTGSSGTDCVSISGTVVGDVCIVTSTNTNYILQSLPGSSSANWVALLTPASPVTTVNGAIGNVSLTATNGLTVSGTAFSLGGTLTGTTTIAQAGNTIKFTGSGNFGIGNALPTQKLDVTGNVKFSGAIMPGGDAGTTGQFLTSAGSGSAPTWTTPTSGWALTGNAGTTAGTNFVGTTDGIDLVFKVNNTERLRIDQTDGRLITSQNHQSTFVDGGNTSFTGIKNTGFGVATLSSLTTGNQNTAVGRSALTSTVSGVNNVAVGLLALGNGTSGNGNVGLGNNALLSTTGSNNVAVGTSAGSGVTSGSSNILIGASADNVTTGSGNIIIGASATAISATTSNQLNIGGWIIGSAGSIGIGTGTLVAPANKLEIKQGTAGLSGLRLTNMLSSSTATSLLNGKVLSVNTTGDVTLVDLNEKSTGFWNLAGNVGALSTDFLGFTDATSLVFKTNNVQTGYIASDGLSIRFGPSAGSSASGTNTFFVGSSAGSSATTASNSTFIGSSAGSSATGAFDSVFMGASAGLSASGAAQSYFIGKEAGKNATFAASSNFIGSTAGSSATNASFSTFIGAAAGSSATNAANSIFIGTSAGASDSVNNTVSGSSILIGNSTSTGGFSNSIALGRAATNTAANQLMIGSTTSEITTVKIQASSPAVQCTITTGSGIACTSDERVKTNIVDITDALTKIQGIRTVTYNLKDKPSTDSQIGFLAQNLETIYPQLVATDAEGWKSVYYSQITPVLVEAIRELDIKVSDFDPGNTDSGSLMAILKNWFASTTNDINEMIAGTVRARNQVCIDDVCMTKDQLRTLLQNSGGSGGGSSVPDPAPVPDPVPSDPLPEPEVVPVVVEPEVPAPAPEETPSVPSEPAL